MAPALRRGDTLRFSLERGGSGRPASGGGGFISLAVNGVPLGRCHTGISPEQTLWPAVWLWGGACGAALTLLRCDVESAAP